MKKKPLFQLIFFVTNRCNSHCRHCFNWKNLNTAIDIDLEEIEKLSLKLPKIKNLLLSGGEPFLRPDLADLVAIFVKNNQIENLSIPTNGLLERESISSLKKILMLKKLKSVNINFSLDGLEETHNYIRGVENNFNISLHTLKKVAELKSEHPSLNILVNSVITEENQKELLDLADLISSQEQVNGHFFEIIRPLGPQESNKLNITFKFYRSLLKRQYNYFKKNLKTKNIIKKTLQKILFLGKMSLYYRIQYRNYFQQKPWPMKCRAGKNIVVLNDKGFLAHCESRAKTFNLRNYSSFDALSQSPEYRKELENIERDKCFCTHICFIDSSVHYLGFRKNFLFFAHGIINYIYYEIISHNS